MAAWGGAPEDLLKAAGYRIRRTDSNSPGLYEVSTEEHYGRTAPGIFTAHHLAGPGLAHDRFDFVESIASRGPSIVPQLNRADELENLFARMQLTKDVVDMIAFQQVRTLLAPQAEITETIRQTFYDIGQSPLEDKPTEAAFPNASVHIVQVNNKLRFRIKLVSFLLRYAYDATFTSGDSRTVIEENRAGNLVFQSADGLLDGTILLDVYLGPLLSCLTPGVWAFPAIRAFGPVIYSLGRPLAGTRRDVAAEVLQVLPTLGADRATEFPELSARACGEAISWWSAKLDRLFGNLSDPAVFTMHDGSFAYSPIKHLHGLLSVEQLFRRVHSLQVAHRDRNARFVIFYSVLDTIHGLTGHEIEVLCDPVFAKKTVDTLRSAMTPEAASVLLWSAERALIALSELQAGFFLKDQTTPDKFTYTNVHGTRESISWEKATAHYVKVLRNATHGYGDIVASRTSRTNSLLASHNGQLPHDLPLLAFVYLLKILLDHATLREQLHYRSKI
ncbi:MAG: hypothetical protein M3332_17330 [Actinomycetota bacterium]|nr:hypothetical protein [Actinomycetota bacterium]